jgi:hypothetical protein
VGTITARAGPGTRTGSRRPGSSLSLSLEEAKKHEYPHDEPVTIHKELTPDYCSRWPDAWRAINHLILRDTDRVGLFEHFLGEATDSAGLALRRSFVGERLRLLSATPRQLCEAILDTTKAQHKEEETAP